MGGNYGTRKQYRNDKGAIGEFYSDGHLTLVPNGSLGSTVFGTTPEESDLQSGNTPEAEVEVVDQGFAITTTKTID